MRGHMDDFYVGSAVDLMLDEIVRLLGQIKSVGEEQKRDLRTLSGRHAAQLERGLAGSLEQDVRVAAKRADGRTFML